MPEFSTQINSEITETLAVLCPGTRIDYVTVIVVAIFILSSTYKCNFLGADNKQ